MRKYTDVYKGEEPPKRKDVLWAHHSIKDDLTSPVVVQIFSKGKWVDAYEGGGGAEVERLAEELGDITDLKTTDKDSTVDAINEVVDNVGDLSDLTTTAKTDLVSAINEASTKGDPASLLYTAQSLTEAQKTQALANIGAASQQEFESLSAGEVVPVTELPNASNDTMGKIYLVGPDANDEYDRYISSYNGTNYSWVQVGTTQMDLSGYATDEEVSQLEHKVDGLPYDADKLASVKIFGTIGSNYAWWGTAVKIPSGCLLRNIGNLKVNLYETKGDPDSQYVSIDVGATITTTFDITGIRSTATGGDFKLVAYVDAELFSSFETDIVSGGIKPLSKNLAAYTTWNLPIEIPANKLLRFEFSATSNFVLYTNYGEADQKNYQIIDGETTDIFYPQTLKNLRTSAATNIKITVVNRDFVIRENGVESQSILDNSVTVDKIQGQHINSLNLYDKSKGRDGYYINQSNGIITANASLSASDYIPVTSGEHYTCYPSSGQYALFDENKVYVSGGATISTVLIPNGVSFIRMSVNITNKDTTIFNTGQTSESYVPYSHKVKNLDILTGIDEDSFNALHIAKVISSRLWNGYLVTDDDAMGNGDSLSLNDYPKSLMKGDKISFFAKVTSWGNGITIGKGTTDTNAAYAEINATNIVLKVYAWGSEVIAGTVAHGLTFSDFVKVVIDISATKWKFIIQTLTDTFTTEINCAYDNGTPRVTSNGAILTNVSLSCTNNDFARPIWMFGDSYFGIASNIRELYWLSQWGYLNVLVQGYAGQSSAGAFPDLERCIAISKPKYLVWALGMNDNTSLASWQSYVADVKAICDANGIELILATIPQAKNTTTYKYKDDMSAWIRNNSGLRYIDVAKAVGSNADGEWYGYGETYDYQSSDNVHPSVYGAKAIATQFLIDFPEILQY